jgi:hypothetical protein
MPLVRKPARAAYRFSTSATESAVRTSMPTWPPLLILRKYRALYDTGYVRPSLHRLHRAEAHTVRDSGLLPGALFPLERRIIIRRPSGAGRQILTPPAWTSQLVPANGRQLANVHRGTTTAAVPS